MSPATAATIVGDANTTVVADQNKNARTYTANVGTASAVSIALVDPADVTVTANKVTFERVGAIASLTPATGIFVNQINGITVANGTSFSNVIPAAGVVTFRVNGNETNFGSAIPVVFEATAGNLTVDTTGAPTKGFGIGGQTTVTPVATATAVTTAVTVESVSGNSYIAGTPTASANYVFSDTDTFKIGTITLTAAQFKADLVVGDTITANPYSTTGARTFTINVLIPGVPTMGTAAEYDSTNSGATPDSVKLTWTNPNNVGLLTGATNYVVQTAKVTGGVVGTFGALSSAQITSEVVTAPTGTAAANGAANAVFLLPTAGVWVYRVRVTGFGGGVNDAPWSATSNAITVAAGAAAISGLVPNGFVVTTDTTDAGNLGAGDVLTATFASGVAVTGSSTITVVNELGDKAVITQGATTATFAASGNNLVVTLLAPPVVTGTTPFAINASTRELQLNNTSGVTSSVDASVLPNLRDNSTNAARTALGSLPPVMPAAATAVSASGSADTVTATVAANGFVRVYNETGRTLLATSPVRATAGSITFGVTGLVSGQSVLVVQSINDATSLIESIPAGIIAAVTASAETDAIAKSAAAAGGAVVLNIGAEATLPIAWNATTAQIAAALLALPSVTVLPTVTNDFTSATTTTIVFDAADGNVGNLTATSNSLVTSVPGPVTLTPSTTTQGVTGVTAAAPGTTVS